MASHAHAPQNDAAIDTIAPILPRDIELTAVSRSGSKSKSDDPFLVIFKELYDVENPKNWPTSRKWAVTDVLSATGFNRIMVSTIMAPALSTIAKELDMNSTESAMALSIYLLATAFGPLFIGPLSEIYGRQKILHVSNVWFLLWNVVCGFATSKGLLIAARFLAGFGASAIYALAGGVLGDVWPAKERGRSLGVYLLIPLLGAAVGPIIGGFMAARTTWRWMFWATSIFQAVMILVSLTSFKETYAPLILKRRAERLRHDTGDQRYYTTFERLNADQHVLNLLSRTLSRPLRLLAFHPIIQITSVLAGFYYGMLYIALSTFSDLWIHQYRQPVELSGLHYMACALGELSGSRLGGCVMDFLFRRMESRERQHTPEHRIIFVFPGAFLASLGFLIYGWTAQYQVHWLAVDVGMVVATFGMQVGSMALQAYVIDVYPDHTSSAMAATQFLKSLTAFLFPLFAPSMYNTLGYGWGNSILAFAGLAFGLPAPLVLWRWGGHLRNRAISTY